LIFFEDHFEVVSTTNTEEILHLYFEEKANQPKKFDTVELVSKGFKVEITIQDFPLRGKFVYLHIKRRRWTNNTNGEIVKINSNLVAKGTSITHDFAAFLKEINRL
jgi:hypothetical protein